jgi:enoyl-CoA hydratase/carnithine racemase
MTDLIEQTTTDGVRILRMNRPDKKNALTAAMYATLAEALAESDRDASIGARLILGVPGAFSAGNDINDFAAFAMKGNLGNEVLAFLRALAMSEKPIVGAADGIAVGVGTTMLLHCDHVILSNRTKLHTPFVNLALVPEAGSSLIAPRMVGQVRAFELLVMGRPMAAEAAVAAGLANAVVSPEELEVVGLAAAKEIAAKPRQAVMLSRKLLRGDQDAILKRIDDEAQLFAERLRSTEAQTAFKAFLAKKG